MEDGGEQANVEIEDGEAVVGNSQGVKLFGGAHAKNVSSRGFMAYGAGHKEKNTAGSEGIPMGSEESVNVASKRITEKGWPVGKKYGQSQAADVKPILAYFEKAEQNPNDRFLNDENTKKMLDDELAYLEQQQNEGRFMKGLHGLLKKKDRDFGNIMDYIIKENPNDAQAVMGGEQAIPGAIDQQGMMASQQRQETPADPKMNPGMPGQSPPVARYGGRANYQLGGDADPSRMTPQQRYEYNMRNNKYQMGGAVPPEMMQAQMGAAGPVDPMGMQGMPMDPSMMGGGMGSSLPPELLAAQGQGVDPMQEMAMAQEAGMGMDPAMQEAGVEGETEAMPDQTGIGMQVAQQVMTALPNVLAITPEEAAANPNDIFSEGFEKELLQLGMPMEEVKQVHVSELHTGKIGEILGQMLQDASPAGKEPGALTAGAMLPEEAIQGAGMEEMAMQAMPQEGMGQEGIPPGMESQVPPEMMQEQAMAEVQQMMAYGGRPKFQGDKDEETIRLAHESLEQYAKSKDFKNLPYHPKYPFDIYDMAKSGMHGSDFIDGAVTENNYAEANSLRDYLLRQKESGQDLRFINKAPVDTRNLQNKDFEFDEAWYKKAIENSNEEQRNKFNQQLRGFNQAKEEKKLSRLIHGGRNGQGYPDWKFQRSKYINNNWRPTFQDGRRTPGQMDIAMAQQRSEQDVSDVPNINIQSIDPASFESAVPNPQLTGPSYLEQFYTPSFLMKQNLPYKGFETRFSRNEYDIPIPETTKTDPKELKTRAPYITESEDYSSLGIKAGKTASGRDKALHENVANTLKGMFKGQEATGDPSSKGILTTQGRQYFAMQGMTPDAMDALTYENLPTSEAWKKYIGPEMARKYKTLKREGEGAAIMNKIKRTKYKNPMFATIDILSDALEGGKNFIGLEKEVKEHINDFLQSPSGHGITKEDLTHNKAEIAKKFNEYNTSAVNKHKYEKYYDIVNAYGSGVEQSKTKEQLMGIKSKTTKKHVPLETEVIDYGKKGKGMSFAQAFAHNRKIGAVVFDWDGKTYTTKRTSELTPKEKAAYERAKKRPKPSKPPKPWSTPPGTGEIPGEESAFAKQATGEGVTRQPVAPKTGKYKGGFDIQHTERELVPLGQKAYGGRVSGLRNGQYVKFRKGGRTISGTVTDWDEETGDFRVV